MTKREEIEEKVRAMLIDDLEIDASKVNPSARLKDDLGIDSLDVVDIVVLVKQTFGIKLKTEELQRPATLADFCDLIEHNLKTH